MYFSYPSAGCLHCSHRAGPPSRWAVTAVFSPVSSWRAACASQGTCSGFSSLLTFPGVSMELRLVVCRRRPLPDIWALSYFPLQTMERQLSPKFEEDRLTACSRWES